MLINLALTYTDSLLVPQTGRNQIAMPNPEGSKVYGPKFDPGNRMGKIPVFLYPEHATLDAVAVLEANYLEDSRAERCTVSTVHLFPFSFFLMRTI